VDEPVRDPLKTIAQRGIASSNGPMALIMKETLSEEQVDMVKEK
jgi:hypothetical protein